MNLIKPTPLKKGNTIGFLTACGAIEEIEKVENAKKYFENKGYKVIISDTTYTQKGFLSADDDVRLAQLHEFFADDEINAILCTRGGYGAIRLIEKIDYDLIKNNPKIFAGFSDVTAFLTNFTIKSNLKTFHAPMPCYNFASTEINQLTENSFFNILQGEKFSAKLNGKIYSAGEQQGILWGGNLATLASMVGTKFAPNEKFILFLEDINEPAYKIDRYLTQLMFDKNFKKNLSGIVLGEFTNLDEQTLFDNIFYELGEKLNIPIISGLKIGHVLEQITIPLGTFVNFDTEKREIIELE